MYSVVYTEKNIQKYKRTLSTLSIIIDWCSFFNQILLMYSIVYTEKNIQKTDNEAH